jgi:hypothetical protein
MFHSITWVKHRSQIFAQMLNTDRSKLVANQPKLTDLASTCHICLWIFLLSICAGVLFSETWYDLGVLRGEKYWESHNSWILEYEGTDVVLVDLGLVLMRMN